MEIGAGTQLGRYQLLAEIGRGAMGTVFQALDPEIDRLVAIKTFSLVDADSSEGQAFRERFAQEARAAGRLTHPGIVTVYDRGEEPTTNTPYIVMEYVAGQPLSALIAQANGRLEERFALQVAMEVAEALAYAHEKGVVHRDIKPANILISEDGNAKIADFGVARVDLSNLTIKGEVFGTPAFMAPEQITGGSVDGRSDIFSLGVILYTMLIGFRPFQGNSLHTVGFKVVNQEPVPITSFHLDLSKHSEYVVARAMAKSPASRYQTGTEFARDLGDILEGREPRSRQDATIRVSSEVFRVSEAYRPFAAIMANQGLKPKHVSTFPDPPSQGSVAVAVAPALDPATTPTGNFAAPEPTTVAGPQLVPAVAAPTQAQTIPPMRGGIVFPSGRVATLALCGIAAFGAAIGLLVNHSQRAALRAADIGIGVPAVYAAVLPQPPVQPKTASIVEEDDVTVRVPKAKPAKPNKPEHSKSAGNDLDFTVVKGPKKAPVAVPLMVAATAAPVALPAPSLPTMPSSTLELSLQHHFVDAEFSVWVDGKLAYSDSVHGEQKKHLLVLHGVEGKEVHDVHFSPGAHDIKVRVVSSDANFDQTETVHGAFADHGKSVLTIRCNKHALELKLAAGS